MTDAMTREEREARLNGWVSHCVNSWTENAAVPYGGIVIARLYQHSARKLEGEVDAIKASITELVTAARAAGAAAERERVCEWRNTNPDGSLWEAPCGVAFTFNAGDPKANRVEWCPVCRGLVRVVETQEGNGDGVL